MNGGSTRAYKLWAIASSTLCLLLVGYIVASHVTAPTGDGRMGGSSGLETEIVVPDALRELPQEWMSAELEKGARGHSVGVRFAPSGEFIAERCTHRGYFDIDRGERRASDWPFCEMLLEGRVTAIRDGAVTVRSADGTLAEVAMQSIGTLEAPRLVLDLNGAPLELVPGSRNDLYQRMEALPRIQAEREAMLQGEAGTRPGDR